MKLMKYSTPAYAIAIVLCLSVSGCKENTSTPPAHSESATRDADNTARNTRDRNEATLTPGDQGETATDRDTTIKIRKAVVSGTNDYSVVAQNIKIITVNGKVTLRGPVKTEAEKAGIAAIATDVAGAANVANELEVKAIP
jgi:osmotically-inducible protein OsmY